MEIRQLTFLRFIAAAAVVIFHTGRGVQSLAWGSALWERANTAVSFFFVLSGFILAHVYGSRGIRRPMDFYVARFARIVPLYWLALASMVAYALYKGAFDPVAGVLGALLLQAWLPSYAFTLNGPGWSLSVEVLFYALFPLTLLGLQRVRSTLGLAAIMTAIWLSNLALHVILMDAAQAQSDTSLLRFAAYDPLTHFPTFVFGVIAGVLYGRHRPSLAGVATPLILAAVAGIAALIFVPNSIVHYHHNGLFAPFFAMLLWGLASGPELWISRWMSWAPLVLLGEASYGVYILQAPVRVFHASVAGRLHATGEMFFWSYFALLMVVSILCFLYFEVPLREWIKQRYVSARGQASTEVA